MKKIFFNKRNLYLLLSAVVFAAILLIGQSYEQTASWNMIFGSLSTFGIAILKWLILTIFMYIILALMRVLVEKIMKLEIDTKENKFHQFFEKHTFMITLIVMLLGWSIYIVAFYPSIITIDALNQLKQFFGLKNYYSDTVVLLSENMLITNHHPVLHTLLMGGLLKLGKLVGNDNLGIFFYSLVQIGILASTLAYTVQYLKENGVKQRFLYWMLVIYTFVPTFPFYAMTATKDVIYTALVILYIIELHKLLKTIKIDKITWKQVSKMILLMLLVCLTRNNGIYVVLLSFLPIIWQSKINWKKCLLVFWSVLLLWEGYSRLLLPACQISSNSKREALSLPFQQTARYIRYYEDEITEEEKQTIDKVLNYEAIKANYDPENADPIKGTYHKRSTNEDLKAYFKIWGKEFLQHPILYIEQLFNGGYAYFYPQNMKYYIHYEDINNPILNLIANFGYLNFNEDFMDYHFNDLSDLRMGLTRFTMKFQKIPVLGWTVNGGMNTWVIILLAFYCISKKEKKGLLLLPSIVTILVCLASPLNSCFRYIMPVVFANPLLVGLLLLSNKKTKKDKKSTT